MPLSYDVTVIQWIMSYVINNVMTTCYITLLAGTSNNANFRGNKQDLKAIKSHLKGHMIIRILH